MSKIVEGLKRVSKVAKKPSREEFMLLLKINVIGVVAIGTITFLVRVVAMVFLGR